MYKNFTACDVYQTSIYFYLRLPVCIWLTGTSVINVSLALSRLAAIVTLVIWRLSSCCCQLRIVSSLEIQMLMLPTSTHFPTSRMRMQRVELRSRSRSLMSRGFCWSSRTELGSAKQTGSTTNSWADSVSPGYKNKVLSQATVTVTIGVWSSRSLNGELGVKWTNDDAWDITHSSCQGIWSQRNQHY